MKTEIKALAKQQQDASDELRGTISELHMRIQDGLPPDQLALVEAQLRRLKASLAKKISRETERMGNLPPAGLSPA